MGLNMKQNYKTFRKKWSEENIQDLAIKEILALTQKNPIHERKNW